MGKSVPWWATRHDTCVSEEDSDSPKDLTQAFQTKTRMTQKKEKKLVQFIELKKLADQKSFIRIIQAPIALLQPSLQTKCKFGTGAQNHAEHVLRKHHFIGLCLEWPKTMLGVKVNKKSTSSSLGTGLDAWMTGSLNGLDGGAEQERNHHRTQEPDVRKTGSHRIVEKYSCLSKAGFLLHHAKHRNRIWCKRQVASDLVTCWGWRWQCEGVDCTRDAHHRAW